MINNKKRIVMEVPYFQVPNDVFEIGLDKHELLVYFYLARCSNQGSKAFPSYNKIAEKTGMSRRKAIDCVKSLEEKKLILKEVRYNHEGQKNYSNLYRVEHNISEIVGSASCALGGELHAPNKELDYKEPKKHLHFLKDTENEYISEYLKTMIRYGCSQKRVTEDNLKYITETIDTIQSEGVGVSEWVDAVKAYFEDLPESNDGDILAFLKGVKRHFDIDLDKVKL